jgi:hypothetical protein
MRQALERAVAEDGEHPEVFILFGNLALMEGRLADASVHFEKARILAAAKRWTADQRKRFDRLCHQGDAFVAESRGDWKGGEDGPRRLAGAAAGSCRRPASAREGALRSRTG